MAYITAIFTTYYNNKNYNYDNYNYNNYKYIESNFSSRRKFFVKFLWLLSAAATMYHHYDAKNPLKNI